MLPCSFPPSVALEPPALESPDMSLICMFPDLVATCRTRISGRGPGNVHFRSPVALPHTQGIFIQSEFLTSRVEFLVRLIVAIV